MAKHPVPKRRSTPARSANRYESFVKKTLHNLLKFTKLVKDKDTGDLIPSHTTNPKTGKYRGRVVKPLRTKRVTKVQA